MENACNDLGDRLIAFGKALKNPKMTVNKLADLAADCGFELRIQVRGMPKPEESGQEPTT